MAGDAPAEVSLDALVVLIAKRLTLGTDVAAAKFLDETRIDDPVREKQILDWVANRSTGGSLGRETAVAFFRDQIVANKILQRGLHNYWRAYPDDFPVRRRDLIEEIRPQLNTVNKHMMLLLLSIPHLSRDQLTASSHLLDVRLGDNLYLRQLGDIRHEAAWVALRTLGKVD
jgi:chorismate mutase-like protein